MPTLLVEGWRFIAHSYAMWNQQQLLELRRRPGVTLYHRDAPFYSDSWKPAEGLFTAEQEAALRAIPVPPDGLRPDAVLRLSSPLNFADAGGPPTYICGTTERGVVEPVALVNGDPAPLRTLADRRQTIIAPARFSLDGFLRSGAPAGRAALVPLGVDAEVFTPADDAERAALRASLGWSDRFVFLNIGAMTPNKGIDLLVRAFAQVSERRPGALLVLKGGDDLYASRATVDLALAELPAPAAARVRKQMQYVGVNRSCAQMAELYRAADVYVAPYRAEGFNLPALEAIASGLPIIVTRGGPTDEFSRPEFARGINATTKPVGPGGLRVLVPALPHLASLMEASERDAAWRAGARAAGPAFVRNGWTWRHAVDRLLSVILPAIT